MIEKRWLLGIPVLMALILLVAWPLGELIGVAVDESAVIGQSSLLAADVVRHTLIIGSAVAILSTLLGVAAAFLTERTTVRGVAWLRVGVLVPLMIPPFVAAMSWMRAYGPGGLSDDLLGWELPGLVGPAGIVVVVAINAVPLTYLVTVSAMRTRIESDLEAAARVSGAGPLETATRITFPLMATPILGAAALAFVIGINAFGVPAVLGTPAGFSTMTTQIYQDLVRSARPEAFNRAVIMATGLVAMALVFVILGESLLAGERRRRRPASSRGVVMDRVSPGRMVTGVIWAGILGATLVPLIALVLVAVTRGVGLSPTPGNWTLAHFTEILDSRLMGALGRSVLLASLAATSAVILGGAIAGLRRRGFARLSGAAALLTFAIPGSTLAVAMILSYGPFLRDTLMLILIAYVAKLWAVGHRSIEGSAENIPAELGHAARVSGARPLAVLRTVTLPLLSPAIAAGWLLVFVIAFHELTMSSLLYGPGTDTLAVVVLNIQQLGDVPASSALAVVLTLPALVLAIPLFLIGRLPRRLMGTG